MVHVRWCWRLELPYLQMRPVCSIPLATKDFFSSGKTLASFSVETPVNAPQNPNSPSGPWVWILVQAPSLIAGLMCVAMPFTLSVTHQLKMPL